MSDQQVIFESTDRDGKARRSVGKHDDEFYTIGAGHQLCVDMAKEIERLRAELADVKAGYHQLDRNWQAVHHGAMNPILAAFGTPDATVPAIVAAIGRLQEEVRTLRRIPR
ncbi:MAG: hypothetical protein IT428_17545, partial [Planctomycetaceae bacterium]|nr:hypothetical protein [Planctomycetaceae bacterium]